jgi:hypothetical protein
MRDSDSLLFWSIVGAAAIVGFIVQGSADWLWGGLGGIIVAGLFVCVLWTLIVLRENRAWWRKVPAVCFGLIAIAFMATLFAAWYRLGSRWRSASTSRAWSSNRVAMGTGGTRCWPFSFGLRQPVTIETNSHAARHRAETRRMHAPSRVVGTGHGLPACSMTSRDRFSDSRDLGGWLGPAAPLCCPGRLRAGRASGRTEISRTARSRPPKS